jgi:hypothetical protein
VKRKRLRRPNRSNSSPDVADASGPNMNELNLLHNWDPASLQACHDAAQQLFHNKLHGHKNTGLEFDGLCAMDIVDNFITKKTGLEYTEWGEAHWLAWKTMLNVVRDIAKADPRYYGVSDPKVERYCSLCRAVHPIEEFSSELALRCNRHKKEE